MPTAMSLSLSAAYRRDGRTHEALAREIGVHRHTLIKWLRGERLPAPRFHRAIAKSLKISAVSVKRNYLKKLESGLDLLPTRG